MCISAVGLKNFTVQFLLRLNLAPLLKFIGKIYILVFRGGKIYILNENKYRIKLHVHPYFLR